MATILIVDDDPVLKRMFSLILDDCGYTVLNATNGEHALGVLAKKTVDLVISDITMPKMDGLTLFKTLRATPRFEHLLIVLLGYEQQHLSALALGPDGILTKPCSFRELINTVTQLLPDDPATLALTAQLRNRE